MFRDILECMISVLAKAFIRFCMNPGENLTSHLQFSLSEIIRNISKYLKIDSETVAKYIRDEYDDECSDSSLESDFTSFSCYENGQMDELEDLIEAVICYSSTSIDSEKLKQDVLQLTLNLLKKRNAEIGKMDMKFKTDNR